MTSQKPTFHWLKRIVYGETLIILFLFTACTQSPTPERPPARVSVTPASPTATLAATPLSSATSSATVITQPDSPTPQREEPTPLPTTAPPTATPTLEPLGPFARCPVGETGNVTPGGPLHVLIFNDLGAWRWSDGARTTSPVPLPSGARSPLPSPDGDRFAYTLEPEEGLVELWAMDGDGANRLQLATVSIADYLADSPEYVSDARLSYFWLADRDLLAHHITPVLNAMGDLPHGPVTVADTATGESWLLSTDGDVDQLVYHPQGTQVAALSDDRVQIIDALSGERLLDVSLPLHNFWYSAAYSPNGDKLVIFTEEGIAAVDPGSGARQTVSLDYTPIGMGHFALMPEIIWDTSGQSFYTFIAGGSDVDAIFGPASTFTLWRIDLQPFTAEAINTFEGSLYSARLSPDRQRLAFWSQRPDNVRTLYLADLVSGEQVAYERLHTLEFLNWHPDSARFTYWQFPERAPILGHLCQSPEPLGDVTIPFAGALYWLGPERYIAVEGVDRGEVTGPWQVRLRSVDGENQLLHTIEGAAPQVRFGP